MFGPGLRFLLCALLLAGCEPVLDAQLLELEAVEPSMLEPGASLHVVGAGFPTGRECEVQLEGRLHRPGETSRRVSTVLSGRATSFDRIEVEGLDRKAMQRLGGHGSFEGSLQVAFAAHGDNRRVTGRLEGVRLDLVLSTADTLEAKRSLQGRARELLDFVGIVVAHNEPTGLGLVVDWARPGSRAAAAGLTHGDVIKRVGGVGIHSLSDFAPVRGSTELSLRVQRPGQRQISTVTLPLSGLFSPDLQARALQLSLLSAALLLCLLLLSPLPSPAAWLARCASRLRAAPAASEALWGGPATQPPQQATRFRRLRLRLVTLMLPLVISVLWLGFVYFESLSGVHFNSLPIYLGYAAFGLTATLLLRSGGSRAQRTQDALYQLQRMLVMAIVIACACAASGTRSLEGIVAAQGALPWGWALFRQPALLVAFPLFIVQATRFPGLVLTTGNVPALFAGIEIGGRVLLCGIGAAVFLGGWQTDTLQILGPGDGRVLGAALFVTKCWSMAMLIHLAKRIGLGDATRPLTTAAVCCACLGLCILWLWLDPAPASIVATGYVLAATTAATLALSSLQVLLADHPMGSRPVHPAPFL